MACPASENQEQEPASHQCWVAVLSDSRSMLRILQGTHGPGASPEPTLGGWSWVNQLPTAHQPPALAVPLLVKLSSLSISASFKA